jgi:hypothetical protein
MRDCVICTGMVGCSMSWVSYVLVPVLVLYQYVLHLQRTDLTRFDGSPLLRRGTTPIHHSKNTVLERRVSFTTESSQYSYCIALGCVVG